MSYQEQVERELLELGPLATIVNKLKSKAWRKVLIFADDDPDGVTAAVVLTRLFKDLGIEYSLDMPAPFELEAFRVKEWTANARYDAIFCIDKGTCGYYDEFATPGRDFVIIDHHFYQGNPEKCIVYNPKKPCCTAYLCHRLMTAMGHRHDFDDYATLIGLRSDWAIRPHVTPVADFIEPFYAEVTRKFPRTFVKITTRPTWMEIDQREWTVPLNQIAELAFAVSGGGFQYWYGDRDPSLKDRHPPTFLYNSLIKMGQNMVHLEDIESLGDFLRVMPEEKVARKMYEWYLKDWDAASGFLDNAFLVRKLGPASIYLYVGGDVPLLPMVGSVKLGEMVKKNRDAAAVLIMAVQLKSGWTHFSLRGTTDRIHVGKICSQMASRLVAKHGFKDEITGGGHPQAGECKVRRPEISFFSNLHELMEYIGKLESLDAAFVSKKLAAGDKPYAIDLGLTYVS